MKKWYNLGNDRGGLDVPPAVCDQIKDSTADLTEEKKKEALLIYYLCTMPMASWPSVAGALHRMEEKTASQAVEVYLKDTPAGQSSYKAIPFMHGYVHVDVMYIVMRSYHLSMTSLLLFVVFRSKSHSREPLKCVGKHE